MRYFLGIRPPSFLLDSVNRFRQQQSWQGIEPHITVKAPCGLDRQNEWLPIVRQLCQTVLALPIEISGIGTFGNTTLFLRVVSPTLVALHHRLLQELRISKVDQETCYEGARYTPHLTLLHEPDSAIASVTKAATAAGNLFFKSVFFHAAELLVYSKVEESEYQVLETIPFCGTSPVHLLPTPA